MTVRIFVGDYKDVLGALPAQSVQSCITSPPYWKQRDYGVPGQLGQEPTHDCLGWATGRSCGECYVCHLVDFADHLRPVLRNDGTFWLVLDGCYAGSGSSNHHTAFGDGAERVPAAEGCSPTPTPDGYKDKDWIATPWHIGLALQAAGWWLRRPVIWAKPNPMPEPVQDRPVKSHENVLLLAKAAHYYYDADAVREPPADYERKGGTAPYTAGGYTTNGVGSSSLHQMAPNGRNRRDVWTVATESFGGAHFAPFPTALVELMVQAGTRAGDLVLDPFCGTGTTGLVADRLQRDAVLGDLNPRYAQMTYERIRGDAPMLVDITKEDLRHETKETTG